MPRRSPASTARAATSLSRQWVFGYGSLVHVTNLARFVAGHGLKLGAYRYEQLTGFRRSWSVAMDNAHKIAGYKCYVDAATDERPEVFIGFANIEPEIEARIHGLLFEADARALEVLDQRERNYRRTDVTQHVSAEVDGTVWTYVGHPDANARYHHALRTDALVLDQAYVEDIAAAFAHAGLPYEPRLPPSARIMRLKRVDIDV